MASSRRSRKNALPKATLERAREQAGLEPEENEQDSEETAAEALDNVSRTASGRRGNGRSKLNSEARIERARARGELDQEAIRELLANPIRTVSEEELHRDYGHVLVDLRNMGVLSAVLIGALVVISLLI